MPKAGRVPLDRLAGLIDSSELGRGFRGRQEGRVELRRVASGQPRCARRATTADDHGRPWLLEGLGERGRVHHGVVLPLEAEGVAIGRGPQPGNDGQLLLEASEALAKRGEGDAVGSVLLEVPARTEADLYASTTHRIDLGDGDGQGARSPKGGRGDQGAQPDRGGLSGEAGERDPGVRGSRQPRGATHGQVVIGAEEGIKTFAFGASSHAQLLVVGGALLWFEEDSQSHLRIIAEDPALCDDGA